LLDPNKNGVSCAVSYANGVATLNPTVPLVASTLYTASLSTAVKDVAGTPMAASYSWTFTTGAGDVAPTVLSTVPLTSATGVSLSASVSATFSEAMSSASINDANFLLLDPNKNGVSCVISYSNGVATLNPTVPLLGNTVYTASLSVGVKDVAGTPMAAPYSWSFTTAPGDTAPTIVSTTPPNTAAGVGTTSSISATFSESMNPSTINNANFTLLDPNKNGVSCSVSYANGVATLNPTVPLLVNTTYTATVTVGVTDVAGNPMAAPYTWTFTTGTTPRAHT